MVRLLKKRYLGFTVTANRPLTRKEIWRLLLTELSRLHTPIPRVRLIEYQRASGLGILLCTHKNVEDIRQLLAHINEKHAETIVMRVLGVSGTLRSLRRKLFLQRNVKNNDNIRKSF